LVTLIFLWCLVLMDSVLSCSELDCSWFLLAGLCYGLILVLNDIDFCYVGCFGHAYSGLLILSWSVVGTEVLWVLDFCGL
jgi:hypothetical protein